MNREYRCVVWALGGSHIQHRMVLWEYGASCAVELAEVDGSVDGEENMNFNDSPDMFFVAESDFETCT